MKPNSLVPQSKDDLQSVDVLRGHIARNGYDSELASSIPQLLAWIVDRHWPVAMEIASVLKHAGTLLVEPLREVLSSDDFGAKFAVLAALVRNLDSDVLGALEPVLAQVAAIQDEEGAGEAAEEILRLRLGRRG